MSTDSIQGPGMLWVTSRISPESASLLDEPTFLRWYDTDHIPEIVATSGIKDAFRYIDVDKDTPRAPSKPFMAFYPMQDLTFTLGQEFRDIKVKSDILPGSGIVYDLADFDVAYLGFVGSGGRSEPEGAAAYLLVSAIEPAEGVSEKEVQNFFDEQNRVFADREASPHYIRSLRFNLQYARTNAQARALKGLPVEKDEPHPEPPTWWNIHEFSAEPTGEELAKIRAESGAHGEVLRHARQKDVRVYKLVKAFGRGKFFPTQNA